MKIYGNQNCPNPRRVRMFMAVERLLGQGGVHPGGYREGENLTPEFVARNPMKKVPVLELEDGNCIAETMAICRYFEEAYADTPTLLGDTPLEKAQIEQWLRWVEFYFYLPVGMCFQHTTGYFKGRSDPRQGRGER